MKSLMLKIKTLTFRFFTILLVKFEIAKKGARWWWHRPLILAFGRQSQVDFRVRGQLGPQSEFQDRQSYIFERAYLKSKTEWAMKFTFSGLCSVLHCESTGLANHIPLSKNMSSSPFGEHSTQQPSKVMCVWSKTQRERRYILVSGHNHEDRVSNFILYI